MEEGIFKQVILDCPYCEEGGGVVLLCFNRKIKIKCSGCNKFFKIPDRVFAEAFSEKGSKQERERLFKIIDESVEKRIVKGDISGLPNEKELLRGNKILMNIKDVIKKKVSKN